MAGRPRKINPNGATKAITVIVAEQTYDALKKQAAADDVTIGDTIRTILNAGVKVAG